MLTRVPYILLITNIVSSSSSLWSSSSLIVRCLLSIAIYGLHIIPSVSWMNLFRHCTVSHEITMKFKQQVLTYITVHSLIGRYRFFNHYLSHINSLHAGHSATFCVPCIQSVAPSARRRGVFFRFVSIVAIQLTSHREMIYVQQLLSCITIIPFSRAIFAPRVYVEPVLQR